VGAFLGGNRFKEIIIAEASTEAAIFSPALKRSMLLSDSLVFSKHEWVTSRWRCLELGKDHQKTPLFLLFPNLLGLLVSLRRISFGS
jgi:hypothetical protein